MWFNKKSLNKVYVKNFLKNSLLFSKRDTLFFFETFIKKNDLSLLYSSSTVQKNYLKFFQNYLLFFYDKYIFLKQFIKNYFFQTIFIRYVYLSFLNLNVKNNKKFITYIFFYLNLLLKKNYFFILNNKLNIQNIFYKFLNQKVILKFFLFNFYYMNLFDIFIIFYERKLILKKDIFFNLKIELLKTFSVRNLKNLWKFFKFYVKGDLVFFNEGVTWISTKNFLLLKEKKDITFIRSLSFFSIYFFWFNHVFKSEKGEVYSVILNLICNKLILNLKYKINLNYNLNFIFNKYDFNKNLKKDIFNKKKFIYLLKNNKLNSKIFYFFKNKKALGLDYFFKSKDLKNHEINTLNYIFISFFLFKFNLNKNFLKNLKQYNCIFTEKKFISFFFFFFSLLKLNIKFLVNFEDKLLLSSFKNFITFLDFEYLDFLRFYLIQKKNLNIFFLKNEFNNNFLKLFLKVKENSLQFSNKLNLEFLYKDYYFISLKLNKKEIFLLNKKLKFKEKLFYYFLKNNYINFYINKFLFLNLYKLYKLKYSIFYSFIDIKYVLFLKIKYINLILNLNRDNIFLKNKFIIKFIHNLNKNLDYVSFLNDKFNLNFFNFIFFQKILFNFFIQNFYYFFFSKFDIKFDENIKKYVEITNLDIFEEDFIIEKFYSKLDVNWIEKKNEYLKYFLNLQEKNINYLYFFIFFFLNNTVLLNLIKILNKIFFLNFFKNQDLLFNFSSNNFLFLNSNYFDDLKNSDFIFKKYIQIKKRKKVFKKYLNTNIFEKNYKNFIIDLNLKIKEKLYYLNLLKKNIFENIIKNILKYLLLKQNNKNKNKSLYYIFLIVFFSFKLNLNKKKIKYLKYDNELKKRKRLIFENLNILKLYQIWLNNKWLYENRLINYIFKYNVLNIIVDSVKEAAKKKEFLKNDGLYVVDHLNYNNFSNNFCKNCFILSFTSKYVKDFLKIKNFLNLNISGYSIKDIKFIFCTFCGNYKIKIKNLYIKEYFNMKQALLKTIISKKKESLGFIRNELTFFFFNKNKMIVYNNLNILIYKKNSQIFLLKVFFDKKNFYDFWVTKNADKIIFDLFIDDYLNFLSKNRNLYIENKVFFKKIYFKYLNTYYKQTFEENYVNLRKLKKRERKFLKKAKLYEDLKNYSK